MPHVNGLGIDCRELQTPESAPRKSRIGLAQAFFSKTGEKILKTATNGRLEILPLQTNIAGRDNVMNLKQSNKKIRRMIVRFAHLTCCQIRPVEIVALRHESYSCSSDKCRQDKIHVVGRRRLVKANPLLKDKVSAIELVPRGKSQIGKDIHPLCSTVYALAKGQVIGRQIHFPNITRPLAIQNYAPCDDDIHVPAPPDILHPLKHIWPTEIVCIREEQPFPLCHLKSSVPRDGSARILL